MLLKQQVERLVCKGLELWYRLEVVCMYMWALLELDENQVDRLACRLESLCMMAFWKYTLLLKILVLLFESHRLACKVGLKTLLVWVLNRLDCKFEVCKLASWYLLCSLDLLLGYMSAS